MECLGVDGHEGEDQMGETFGIDERYREGVAISCGAVGLPVGYFASIGSSCASCAAVGIVYYAAGTIAFLAWGVAVDWIGIDAVGGSGLWSCLSMASTVKQYLMLHEFGECITRFRNTYPAISITTTASIQRTYLTPLWSILATLCYIEAVGEVV